MTNQEFTVTAEQAAVAYKLAAHFDHHWAWLEEDEVIGKTAAEIEAASVERNEPGIGCTNAAPVFDEDGDITHRTTTGRLHWLIRRDGGVTFKIFRPDPNEDTSDIWREPSDGVQVLQVTLPAAPFAAVAPDATRADDWCWVEGDYYARHIEAAMEAVEAIKEVNPNAAAVLEWLASHKQGLDAS